MEKDPTWPVELSPARSPSRRPPSAVLAVPRGQRVRVAARRQGRHRRPVRVELRLGRQGVHRHASARPATATSRSPRPPEHIQGGQWWTSYQPVSYKIAGRLGDRAAFTDMVDTCHAAGVKVVADAVINHMSAGAGTGTGGSSYTKYDYPGIYSGADFHDCTAHISDYRTATTSRTANSSASPTWTPARSTSAAGHRRLPERPALARRRRLPHRRRQAHAGRRPRRHQVPAEQPGRVLEAGGHPRRRRGRPARASTPATATSRSSGTPATSSGSSTTRTSPT